MCLCRLPYSSKSSSDVPVRSNNAGPNTPDLEILWLPLVNTGFGNKTPPGIYGATLVREASLHSFWSVLVTQRFPLVQAPVVLKPESSGTITVTSSSVYDKPLVDPKYVQSLRCVLPGCTLTFAPRSYLASDNDMNLLVRGVRLIMRIAHTECAKGIFEPKADSTDTNDTFYMGDADPDRVRTISLPPTLLPSSLPIFYSSDLSA